MPLISQMYSTRPGLIWSLHRKQTSHGHVKRSGCNSCWEDQSQDIGLCCVVCLVSGTLRLSDFRDSFFHFISLVITYSHIILIPGREMCRKPCDSPCSMVVNPQGTGSHATAASEGRTLVPRARHLQIFRSGRIPSTLIKGLGVRTSCAKALDLPKMDPFGDGFYNFLPAKMVILGMVYGIRFTRFTTLGLWPIWYDLIGWAFHFFQTRSGCPVPVTVGELAAESGPLGCAGSVLQPSWQGEIPSVKIFIIYPAVKHGNEIGIYHLVMHVSI